MKEIITKLVSLQTEVDSLVEYVKYQESIPKLSKEEKEDLEDMVTHLFWVTNHTYTHIRCFKGDYERVEFFYTSTGEAGKIRSDSIGGLPSFTQKIKPTITYKIEDLLR